MVAVPILYNIRLTRALVSYVIGDVFPIFAHVGVGDGNLLSVSDNSVIQ